MTREEAIARKWLRPAKVVADRGDPTPQTWVDSPTLRIDRTGAVEAVRILTRGPRRFPREDA